MNHLQMIANTVQRRLDQMFPGYFTGIKHNHYKDFGYPEQVSFDNAFDMYNRNGFAKAGVEKTVGKTWQDYPVLIEGEKAEDETAVEKEIRLRFDTLRFWQKLEEADRRSLVGGYAGVILRFADSKTFDQPVDTVPGGIDGLVELIPAWEGQLTVSSWDTDQTSDTYGQPLMFQFSESNVENQSKQPRQFQVHPDRVIVWSKDGTVHCRSFLEPGYNDLVTLEKVSGAGGEGFWKNAKSGLAIEMDSSTKPADMAKVMGVSVDDLTDKIDQQVEEWQKGFDQMLLLQGMTAKTLPITLPSPEHFFSAPLQGFAASINCPVKILVGMQTGERASTEDAEEWAQTNMSRRNRSVIPNIMATVERLVRFGVITPRDWSLSWTDLTEASMGEKIDRVYKMADTNAKMQPSGEWVFTPEEMRQVMDLEPLSDADKYRDEGGEFDDESDPIKDAA